VLEGFADSLKQVLGVERTGESVLIDECQQGLITYRLEIEPEALSCRPKLRLIVSEFKGAGTAGRHQKSFAWTVSNDAYSDLYAMTSKILHALEPDAEVIDVRGVVGRWLDQITGVKHLNHIPVVAEQYGPKKHWIHATLLEDRNGVLVHWVVEFQGRSPLRMCVPLESVRKLHLGLEQLVSSE